MEIDKVLRHGEFEKVREYVKHQERCRNDCADAAWNCGLGFTLIESELDWTRIAIKWMKALLPLVLIPRHQINYL